KRPARRSVHCDSGFPSKKATPVTPLGFTRGPTRPVDTTEDGCQSAEKLRHVLAKNVGGHENRNPREHFAPPAVSSSQPATTLAAGRCRLSGGTKARRGP